MLNCGLGILLFPVFGVLILIKGADVLQALDGVTRFIPGCEGMLTCGVLLLLVTMNDMAAPSVSLEGKSIWIPQSLPVMPKTVLAAKTAMQLILTGVPLLFASVCAVIVIPASAAEKVLICLLPLSFAVFSALFGTFLGVKNPILQWTSETVPLKQGGAVMIALFGGWGIAALIAVPYFLIGFVTGLIWYLAVWTVILAVLSGLLYHWLNTRGAAAFARL